MTAHDPRVTLTEAERYSLGGFAPWSRRSDLHAAVERIIAARLAPIRALVDEWEIGGTILVRKCHSGRDVFEGETQQRAAAAVRAALDAPVSASQDDDGAEGQGQGEKAGEGQFRCDGCMAWLARADVSDGCDGEHVLCKSCDRPDTPAFR